MADISTIKTCLERAIIAENDKEINYVLSFQRVKTFPSELSDAKNQN